MLWYFTQDGLAACLRTGKIGDCGESESTLLLQVRNFLSRKKPGFSSVTLLVYCTIMSGKVISVRLSQRVYWLAKSLPMWGVPSVMTRFTDGLGWKYTTRAK